MGKTPYDTPWRVGRKVGRTIYAQHTEGYGQLLGMMDSVGLAGEVVDCHNRRLAEEALGEQFIITAGYGIHLPVGPFPSEEAAHAEYRRNQPTGQDYLSPPTIVRLLRPVRRSS